MRKQYKYELPLPNDRRSIYHPLRFARLLLELARRFFNAYRFRRRSKSPVAVTEIYQNSWGNVLSKADWKNYSSLIEFINPPRIKRIISTMGHGWVDVSRHDFLKYRMSHLRHVIETELPDNHENLPIVEVGCGWGRNLFCLRAIGYEGYLKGYELTHEAVGAAHHIISHFDVQGVSIEQADLITDALPLENAIVYSYHCLEQIKYNTREVLEKLLAARPRKVIHFEPVPELMRRWHPRDLVNLAYNRMADYQCSLLHELRNLEKEGKVRILSVERQGFYQLPIQETVCLVWEPVKNSSS